MCSLVYINHLYNMHPSAKKKTPLFLCIIRTPKTTKFSIEIFEKTLSFQLEGQIDDID